MKSLLLSILVAGCALTPPPKPAQAPLGPGEIISASAAQNILAVGKSTKADVRAALGEPTAVDFPSGYEVWLYREREKATELVLLFEPSGTLSKTRVR